MDKFNLVKITSVQYADADLDAGEVPSTLTTAGTISDGNFVLTMPEQSTTSEYSEQTQQAYRVRRSPAQFLAQMTLVTSSFEEIAAFTGATYTAAVTGTSGATLSFRGSQVPTNKYIVITGEDTDGDTQIVYLYNCVITFVSDGARGANQETVGVQVNMYLLEDATSDKKLMDVVAATPAAE